MKTLEIHNCTPTARHVSLVEQHGTDTLDQTPVADFYPACPEADGYERAEYGCLIRISGCVRAHTDTWLGDWDKCPRKQRSVFWLLQGELQFKVDGAKAIDMRSGDWVLFDHRREHMVLTDEEWLGAAWQVRPAGNEKQPEAMLRNVS
jgi:hypothetical protein